MDDPADPSRINSIVDQFAPDHLSLYTVNPYHLIDLINARDTIALRDLLSASLATNPNSLPYSNLGFVSWSNGGTHHPIIGPQRRMIRHAIDEYQAHHLSLQQKLNSLSKVLNNNSACDNMVNSFANMFATGMDGHIGIEKSAKNVLKAHPLRTVFERKNPSIIRARFACQHYRTQLLYLDYRLRELSIQDTLLQFVNPDKSVFALAACDVPTLSVLVKFLRRVYPCKKLPGSILADIASAGQLANPVVLSILGVSTDFFEVFEFNSPYFNLNQCISVIQPIFEAIAAEIVNDNQTFLRRPCIVGFIAHFTHNIPQSALLLSSPTNTTFAKIVTTDIISHPDSHAKWYKIYSDKASQFLPDQLKRFEWLNSTMLTPNLSIIDLRNFLNNNYIKPHLPAYDIAFIVMLASPDPLKHSVAFTRYFAATIPSIKEQLIWPDLSKFAEKGRIAQNNNAYHDNILSSIFFTTVINAVQLLSSFDDIQTNKYSKYETDLILVEERNPDPLDPNIEWKYDPETVFDKTLLYNDPNEPLRLQHLFASKKTHLQPSTFIPEYITLLTESLREIALNLSASLRLKFIQYFLSQDYDVLPNQFPLHMAPFYINSPIFARAIADPSFSAYWYNLQQNQTLFEILKKSGLETILSTQYTSKSNHLFSRNGKDCTASLTCITAPLIHLLITLTNNDPTQIYPFLTQTHGHNIISGTIAEIVDHGFPVSTLSNHIPAIHAMFLPYYDFTKLANDFPLEAWRLAWEGVTDTGEQLCRIQSDLLYWGLDSRVFLTQLFGTIDLRFFRTAHFDQTFPFQPYTIDYIQDASVLNNSDEDGKQVTPPKSRRYLDIDPKTVYSSALVKLRDERTTKWLRFTRYPETMECKFSLDLLCSPMTPLPYRRTENIDILMALNLHPVTILQLWLNTSNWEKQYEASKIIFEQVYHITQKFTQLPPVIMQTAVNNTNTQKNNIYIRRYPKYTHDILYDDRYSVQQCLGVFKVIGVQHIKIVTRFLYRDWQSEDHSNITVALVMVLWLLHYAHFIDINDGTYQMIPFNKKPPTFNTAARMVILERENQGLAVARGQTIHPNDLYYGQSFRYKYPPNDDDQDLKQNKEWEWQNLFEDENLDYESSDEDEYIACGWPTSNSSRAGHNEEKLQKQSKIVTRTIPKKSQDDDYYPEDVDDNGKNSNFFDNDSPMRTRKVAKKGTKNGIDFSKFDPPKNDDCNHRNTDFYNPTTAVEAACIFIAQLIPKFYNPHLIHRPFHTMLFELVHDISFDPKNTNTALHKFLISEGVYDEVLLTVNRACPFGQHSQADFINFMSKYPNLGFTSLFSSINSKLKERDNPTHHYLPPWSQLVRRHSKPQDDDYPHGGFDDHNNRNNHQKVGFDAPDVKAAIIEWHNVQTNPLADQFYVSHPAQYQKPKPNDPSHDPYSNNDNDDGTMPCAMQ